MIQYITYLFDTSYCLIFFIQLECCGSQNYTDWFYKKWTTEEMENTSVPESCCAKTEANCNKNVTSHPDTVYSKVFPDSGPPQLYYNTK